jgi:hypothetical protein
MPRHYEQMNSSWQKSKVLSYVPDRLLVEVTKENEEDVLGGFLQGKGKGGRHIGLRGIPWKAWVPPLKIWLPVFFVMMLGLIGLSLVLHRQWTTHEHLVYPIAEFVQLLTGRGEGRALPAVPRDRLFWYGMAPVLVIHLVDGLRAWHPTFIEIPHRIDINPLRELFPTVAQAWGSWGLFAATIHFTVVAFAYFLPSDITLSLGLCNLIRSLFSAALITYGVSTAYTWMGDGEMQGLMFGAFVAVFVMILYNGRAYFGRTLLAAFGRRSPDSPVEPSAVWGFRIFLAASALSVALMTRMGLAWPYAALTLLLFVLLFTAMSRIVAETGLFFVQPSWQPVAVLLGLFGASAIGPGMLAVGILLCLVITIDPREAMMPFIVNALRIGENAGVPRGRLSAAMTVTLAAGLLAGVVAVLWLQYDRGVGLTDAWATGAVPTMGFNLLDEKIQKMSADGVFEQAAAASWTQGLRLFEPNRRFVGFMVTGFALFAACAFLRLRFSKWPLHPVLFAVWFSYPMCCLSTSFFIGWLVKSLVVKFGGAQAYQRGKPFMVGAITGDLLGGLVFMIVGAVYYKITGFPPKRYAIFPG